MGRKLDPDDARMEAADWIGRMTKDGWTVADICAVSQGAIAFLTAVTADDVGDIEHAMTIYAASLEEMTKELYRDSLKAKDKTEKVKATLRYS